MSLLAACSAPVTPAVDTETPTPKTTNTIVFTSTPEPTTIILTKPPPTLISIERETPTKIFTPKPTEIVYPPYDRWISGRESILKGNIMITIDDCNDEKFLSAMLDQLEARGIRATFFPNTNYIIGHSSALWARIMRSHQIGNHTTGHWDLRKNPMTVDQLENDWTNFQNAIRQKTGNPNYVITAARAPYYAWTPEYVQVIKNHNAYLVQSTVSPVEININTFNNILKANGNGGILIFHTDEISYRWFLLNLANLKGNFLRVDDLFK